MGARTPAKTPKPAPKPIRPGYPSKYSPAIATQICDAIAAGASVATAAAEAGVAPKSVYEWLIREPAMSEAYARARVARADARYERIDQVLLDARAGIIDAQVARLEVDAIKWQCGKENNSKYGERLQVDATVTAVTPAQVLREARAKRLQAPE